jgi:AcrR family transcriptional regulator
MILGACHLDPRIRRTRQMLFDALKSLLLEKRFEDISVQDLAERSTLNRATFYDHFPDKFALLEAMIDEGFRARFSERMARTDGTCSQGLRQLILSVCDYLTGNLSACQKAQRQFDPLVETRIKAVVGEFLSEALRHHDVPEPEVKLLSTMAGWAICGAAFDWNRDRRVSADELADSIVPRIQPILKI